MKNGFSLSEVLITLGVIGVIASLTIPQIIAKHRRIEAETRLKKAYSVIYQAFLAAQVKHGDMKGWAEWNDAEAILRLYIAPELKDSKIYPKMDSWAKVMCYEENKPLKTNYQANAQYAWMDNVYISSPFAANNTASIKLTDNTCIGLNNNSGGNSKQKRLFIDINGSYNLPNKAGYDLFVFQIIDNKILPYGYDWTISDLDNTEKQNSCNTQALFGGIVCASKIMQDDWEITYW